MKQVSPKQVQDLRKMSGAGMMDCKNALSESSGNLDDAFVWLREKGIAKAEKKSTRTANEGLIGIKSDDDGACVVEINSETDFVSRNSEFQELVTSILDIAVQKKESINEVGVESKELINNAIAKIGENIVFKRSDYIAGKVYTYTHNKIIDGLGKIGVLIKFSEDLEDLNEIGKNLCMHIAASSPKSLSEKDLDSSLIESEKNFIKEQLKDSGKPDNIVDKMIEGKIKKYFEEVVLLNQKFVMDPSITIEEYLLQISKQKNSSIQIEKFIRFQLGE